MERHSNGLWRVGFIGTVVILGMFAISSLFLTNVGIQVYHNIVRSNNDNFELRTSLNYVATRIRQKDNINGVSITQKDGVDVLTLSYISKSTGYLYHVYIYYYDGYLREHLCLDGDPYELIYGFEMVEAKDFSFRLDGNVLTLSAENEAGDREELVMTMRSGEVSSAR